MSKKCYILVKGHTQGMKIYESLRDENFHVRVAPSPREAKSECGMAVLCECDEIDEALNFATREGIEFDRKLEVEQTFDINRNKFC